MKFHRDDETPGNAGVGAGGPRDAPRPRKRGAYVKGRCTKAEMFERVAYAEGCFARGAYKRGRSSGS